MAGFQGTAVIVTTHGPRGASVATDCLRSVFKYLPGARVHLYVNEGEGETLEMHTKFRHEPALQVTYIPDQSGGLTKTWNDGVVWAKTWDAAVVLFLNDDARVDASIGDLVVAASCTSHPAIYGPVTSPSGAPQNPESWTYHFSQGKLAEPLTVRWVNQWHGVNGFCFAASMGVLTGNAIDDAHVFDPKKPFGGNETEFGKRWFLQGGRCGIVDSCFVDHAKLGLWRNLPRSKFPKVKMLPPPPSTVIKLSDAAAWSAVPTNNTIVMTFVDSIHDLPPVADKTALHSAYVSKRKKSKTVRTHNGWRVTLCAVQKWTPRLRWKQLLMLMNRVMVSRVSRVIVASSTRTGISSCIAMLSSCLQPGDDSVRLGLMPHAVHPSLSAHLGAVGAVSDFVETKFPMSSLSHSASHAYDDSLMVLNVDGKGTKELIGLLELVFTMGTYVNWNMDFALSWCVAYSGTNVKHLHPGWRRKLKA